MPIYMNKGGSSGGGGGYSEELLWTNPNPNTTFYQQNVTLSKNQSNFNYIKVIVSRSTTRPNNKTETIINNGLSSGATLWFGNDSGVLRNIQIASGDNVTITRGTNTGGSEDNNGCIPIELYGVNIS